jgi:hypothetical protein
VSDSTNCWLSDQAMRVEDALRKIRLLQRLVPENGASIAEAETASRWFSHLAPADQGPHLLRRTRIAASSLDRVLSAEHKISGSRIKNAIPENNVHMNEKM